MSERSKLQLAGLGVLALYATSASGQNSYICVAEHMAGFAYDARSKAWFTGRFKPDMRLVIRRAKDVPAPFARKTVKWEMADLGSRIGSSWCDDFNDRGWLLCSGMAEFRFNKTTLRFLRIYTAGYWNSDLSAAAYAFLRDGEDTPLMAIGKCSPID